MAYLLLKILSGHSSGQNDSCQFNEQGGTIGRSEGCQWSLLDHDRFISKVHAQILFQNNQFILKDTSTNGVFVNHSGNLLGKDNQHILQPNDKIFIASYQISVAEILVSESQVVTSPSDGSLLDLVMGEESKPAGSLDPMAAISASQNSHSGAPADASDLGLSDLISGGAIPLQQEFKPQESNDDYKYSTPVESQKPAEPISQPFTQNEPSSPISASIPEDWELSGIMPAVSEYRPEGEQQSSLESQHSDKPTPAQVIADPAVDTPDEAQVSNTPLENVVLGGETPSHNMPEGASVVHETSVPAPTNEERQSSSSVEDILNINVTPPPNYSSPMASAKVSTGDAAQEAASTPVTQSIDPSTDSPEPIATEKTTDAQVQTEPQAIAKQAEVEPAQMKAEVTQPDAFLPMLYQKMGLPKEYLSTIDPEIFADDLVTILSSSTQGLMSLLNGRTVFKQESRLSLTSIQPRSNNPLKFSIDPTDTLEMLLLKKKAGYKTAKEAYEEAISDIQLHQMAFLSGLQATLKGVMKKISPELIEDEVNAQGKAFMGLKTASQNWQLYKDKKAQLDRQINENLNEVLSTYFADAYQAQIDKIRKNSQ